MESIITDKTNCEYPIQLETYLFLAITYSSNTAEVVSNMDAYASNVNGQVKLYLKELPSFEEVFALFLSTKCPIFKTNKQLDVCLSLFFNPYFDEFYKQVRDQASEIPQKHRKYLTKNLLFWLSSAVYYNIVYKTDVFCENSTKDYFIKKDIYIKSKELLGLIK